MLQKFGASSCVACYRPSVVPYCILHKSDKYFNLTKNRQISVSLKQNIILVAVLIILYYYI